MLENKKRIPDFFSGISKVQERYDGYILDLWGVVHDGFHAFDESVECMREIKKRGKKIVLLSNAPRRTSTLRRQLKDLGVFEDLYDDIVSSGQETYDHLVERKDEWYKKLGFNCFHIGPERDNNLLEIVNLKIVNKLSDADFILNTGPWEEGATVDDYVEILKEGVTHNIPMICANPDQIVIRGGKRMICAGKLAVKYENLGGFVKYHGKPGISVYKKCFLSLKAKKINRVVAIGDSLDNDIAGASKAGIESILILDGIHGDLFGSKTNQKPDNERLLNFLSNYKYFPTRIMRKFCW